MIEVSSRDESLRVGQIASIAAYVLWGFIAIFWRQLNAVDSVELICHRVIWSSISIAIVLVVLKYLFGANEISFSRDMFNWNRILWSGVAAILIAINWLVFVWAVQSGQLVETALGYFINPLMSIALGVALFRERIPISQWIAISLAVCGMTYITWNFGRIPWLALTLALSFAFYGIVKKRSSMPALTGLWLETTILLLPAAAYVCYRYLHGQSQFGMMGPSTDLLIMSTGPVTTIPLLLFAIGAKRIPMSQMGLLQYIAPSLQFLVGWILYSELIPTYRWIGFGFVWAGLVVYILAEHVFHLNRKPSF